NAAARVRSAMGRVAIAGARPAGGLRQRPGGDGDAAAHDTGRRGAQARAGAVVAGPNPGVVAGAVSYWGGGPTSADGPRGGTLVLRTSSTAFWSPVRPVKRVSRALIASALGRGAIRRPRSQQSAVASSRWASSRRPTASRAVQRSPTRRAD